MVKTIGPWYYRISVLLRRDNRELFSFFLQKGKEKGMWAHSEMAATYNPGRQNSPETDHAGILISDFQALELWKNESLCSSHLAYGISLSQLILTKTEGHYIMIRGSILQKSTTILDVYISNNIVSKYMSKKSIELQREIDKSTTIVRDFNTPLSEMDRSCRQKISKDILELNNIINQLD